MTRSLALSLLRQGASGHEILEILETCCSLSTWIRSIRPQQEEDA